jgi:hypothetical protein
MRRPFATDLQASPPSLFLILIVQIRILPASCTHRLPYHFLEDTCAENPPAVGGSSFVEA